MSTTKAFFPQAIYAPRTGVVPRVLVAPPKYVQGPGVLERMGRYLGLFDFARVGLLASSRGHGAQAGVVSAALGAVDIAVVPVVFGGECSLEEVDRHTQALAAERLDCLIVVGGGKCVDAGKSIAYRLGVPLVVVPTLASNDAPCSAVSVLYTPEGVALGGEFFPHNPALVVVDTAEIRAAPERYLVAGMGDAMATWYEAKVCMENPDARNVLGARPTRTACAMGELCAHTLYEHGVQAASAVRDNAVDAAHEAALEAALEDVVEANTLLSGVGFESGGLAAAHGYSQGYTNVPAVEHNFLHGEMVAMGVLAQLVMQDERAEAERAATFFASVGLPVHLGQIGLDEKHDGLAAVVEGTMAFAPLGNLPFKVTHTHVRDAMLGASALGRDIAARAGDAAWRRLQGA